MPFRLRIVIGAVAAAGIVTLAVAAAVGGDAGVGPLGEFAAFAVVLGLSWSFPLLVLRREETEAFSLDEAFLVAAAMLLTPFGTILTFGAASIVSQIARRRPLSRLAFNTGMVLCASGLAVGAVNLVGGHRGVRPLDMAAVVLGAAVFLAVNSVLVSAVISVAEDQPFLHTLTDGAAFRLLQWTATVAVGLLGGLAASAYSWALLLTLIPMAAVQVVLAGSLRARKDHERVDALLRAAIEAHASVQSADVEEAVTASARVLLDCRSARLSEEPPGEDELGSRLPGEGWPERFLVVSDRRGHAAFSAQDAKLLDALVAVGSSALDNAGLVEQLKHEAFHDALTGLPNQLLFEETVGLALAERRQPERKLAVFVLDLDRFKRVNDSLGHPAGNELLREVARRLTAAVRTGDTVARMSGDEFTLLATGLRSTGEAAFVAEKVLAVFGTPFLVGGQELFVTASVGIAVSPDDGTRPSVLLKNADTAMYRAKERGRNCFEIYSVDMNAGVEARLALEGDLHHALDTGQLRVVYQPQFDLVTGHLCGVEALARWTHPTLGPIAPDTFIPLAEESGLIVALDDWVMRTACAQLRAWTDAGLPALRMAVNLSGRAFWRSRIVERVTEVLAVTGINPALLELEVTESMAVDTAATAPQGMGRPLFRDLEALGVRLAIDDFGTGYSALGRLQGLPFHTLKIDRSFVEGVENANDEAPIVAAMIAMAHALKLEVVAEGVETEAQRAFLTRNGCDMAQGWLFGRPVDGVEIEALLQPQPLLATAGQA
ncbi:MAG TPA: EAL domain-containing protein [Acidimicrobiia bacterium]|nr:EAL domain-containing protein [Acidimicrobiia bacterium]